MGTAATKGAFRPPTPHQITGVRESDGIRWVRSFKIMHPARQQRIYLMPVPRFATKTFYNDWIYQPYIKDHVLCISTDIEGPPVYQNVAYRLLMKPKAAEFEGYDIYYSPNMPDSVDANITRHEMFQKEFLIRTPVLRALLTTTSFRDRVFHFSYMRKSLHRLLGAQHQYHPGVESGQSFVIFVPVLQANTAINILEDMGFSVTEAIEHDVGEEAKLARLHAVGSWGNFLILGYMWVLLLLILNKYIDYVLENVEKHKEEYYETKARLLRNAQ